MKIMTCFALEQKTYVNQLKETFGEWYNHTVTWIKLHFVDRPFSLLTLVVADIVFVEISLRVAKVVYHRFPKSEDLTIKEKRIKNLVVILAYLSTFTILNISIIKGLKLTIPTPLAVVASTITLCAMTYFKVQ